MSADTLTMTPGVLTMHDLWQATPEVRWFQRPLTAHERKWPGLPDGVPGPYTHTVPQLQQSWLNQTTGEIEWRAVPVVMEGE